MNITISIDDVCPHPNSSVKVLDRCFELIEIFPEIKFVLFIPIAYWRTIRHSTPDPLYISDYFDFCNYIKKLPKKNFKLGYHGCFHGRPGETDNDEFEKLIYKDAFSRFELMRDIIKNSPLENCFSPIFRPPAWRMSPESFKAAFDFGIKHLALLKSPPQNLSYQNEDKNKLYKVSYATCYPPFIPLSFEKNTDIVYHACEWDRNYLSKQLTKDLVSFLKQQKNKISCKFNY